MADDNARLLADAAIAALDRFPGPIGNHLATSYIEAANRHAIDGDPWDWFEYLLESARAVLDSPQPSTEDTSMTNQLHDELLRLINERGVTNLDAEDLANEVTQLFRPDGPGCWAEDEQPVSGNRRFVNFTENNEWEGETWVHWLQVDGNEAELDKLRNLLNDLTESEEEDTEEPEFDLADRNEQTLSEEHVDVLVEHTGCGYMAAHTKVVGKFTCPADLGDGGRALYKGKISDLFTVEVA